MRRLPRASLLCAALLALALPAGATAGGHWRPHVAAAHRYAQGRAGRVASMRDFQYNPIWGRIALAIFTQFNPGHAYGKRTLRGVARRLLRGLG